MYDPFSTHPVAPQPVPGVPGTLPGTPGPTPTPSALSPYAAWRQARPDHSAYMPGGTLAPTDGSPWQQAWSSAIRGWHHQRPQPGGMQWPGMGGGAQQIPESGNQGQQQLPPWMNNPAYQNIFQHMMSGGSPPFNPSYGG